MKYAILRNKSVGDKDLEMNTTYKKRRLFEIQQKELEEDQELGLSELEDGDDEEIP